MTSLAKIKLFVLCIYDLNMYMFLIVVRISLLEILKKNTLMLKINNSALN